MTAPLSSPYPTGSHPSVDDLADLAEGLVDDPAAAAALQAHLTGCADCRETAGALAEVQDLLGAVEAPPMPADVAARIDAALAAEAAARPPAAAVPAAAPAPAAAPVPAVVPAVRAAGPAAEVPATAPAPTRVPAPPSAPAGRPAGSTGPGRPHTRRRRARLLLGAAAALAALGLGGVLLLPGTGSERLADTAAKAGPAPAAAAQSPRPTGEAAGAARPQPSLAPGGTVYREDRLPAQIHRLLAGAGSGAPSALPPGTAGGSATAVPPADGGPGISRGPSSPPCPAPAPGTPLATDRGTYRGEPVDVLVYAGPDGSGQLDVYLRAAECGPVLLHRTVPAP
ncbi:hypothetical protein ACWGB8_26980 [Kitasatospora sp. NPDC054939]